MDTEDNFGKERKRQSNVYVFCLLAQKEKLQVSPLNLEQWGFYVIPTSLIDKEMGATHSITLARVRKYSHPYKFRQLREAITA